MEKSSATEHSSEEEDGPGLLEWAMLGAAAYPWAYLVGALISAKDPSTSRLGFSGYVTNQTAGIGGGGGVKPVAPFIVLLTIPDSQPPTLSVPPIPGPRSLIIGGAGFVPYELVSLQEDGTQFDTVQMDVDGAFGNYTYSPSPIIEGWHTITAVDLDFGVRVEKKWFGFFPSTGRT